MNEPLDDKIKTRSVDVALFSLSTVHSQSNNLNELHCFALERCLDHNACQPLLKGFDKHA